MLRRTLQRTAFLFFWTGLLLLPQPAKAANCGDVNLDGMVNVVDIVLVINYIFGQTQLNDVQIKNADANCDKLINIMDVVGIVGVISGTGGSTGFSDGCWDDDDDDGCMAIDDPDDQDPAILCDSTSSYQSPDLVDNDNDGFLNIFGGGYDCDDNDPTINFDTDGDLDCVRNEVDNCPGQFNPDQTDSDNNGVGDRCDWNTVCGGVFNAQLLCDDPNALNYCPPCNANPFIGETCGDGVQVDDCLSESWKNSSCQGCIYQMPACNCEPVVWWEGGGYYFTADSVAAELCAAGSISYSGNGMIFEQNLTPHCEASYDPQTIPSHCPNGNCNSCQSDEDCTQPGQLPNVTCTNGSCHQCNADEDCPGPGGYCIDNWGTSRPRMCGNSTCACAEADPWEPPEQCICSWKKACINCDGYCRASPYMGNCAGQSGIPSDDCTAFCNVCFSVGVCNGKGQTPLGTLCSNDDECKGYQANDAGVLSNDGDCQPSVCNEDSSPDRVGEGCSEQNMCGNEIHGGRCIYGPEDCCEKVNLRGYDTWPSCGEIPDNPGY